LIPVLFMNYCETELFIEINKLELLCGTGMTAVQ
jgi:hypothetical protein